METKELPLSYRQVFIKLKEQIDRSLHSGLHTQTPEFIEEFSYTYLCYLSLLSQLRSRPEWKSVIPSCQKLIIQANLLLYPEEGTSSHSLWQALWIKLPAQLWENRYYTLTALLVFLVSTLVGYVIVRENFEMASVFMSTFLRSSHDLQAYLFEKTAQNQMLTGGRGMGMEMKLVFSMGLFTNNMMVAVRCFVFGILYGIPTLYMLVETGLMMGTLPALFYGGDEIGLWAWLLPHGVPELSAIILSGGIGLKLGFTMLHPGARGYRMALKNALKSMTFTIVVCAILLIWAAIVESFIRQSELSNQARFVIAGMSCIPMYLLYVRAYYAYKSLYTPEIPELFPIH